MRKQYKYLLLIVAIIFSPFMLQQTNAQEIGLQLYSLRNQFKSDVPGTLKAISSWGITKIEGGNTYGLPLDAFKKLLAQNNLTATSIGVSFEELQNTPELVLEKAKSYGVKYVMCAWIPHDGDNFTIKEAQLGIDVFNAAGKILKAEGITLAYHAHGYEFRPYADGTLFNHMAKNATHFAFEMDVYWIQHAGVDPMTLLNKYPEKFVLMHLKDMVKGLKGNNAGHSDVETNVTLGTGQIDIAGLVKRGKELGIEYMFIEDESSRSADQIPKSFNYLKGLE